MRLITQNLMCCVQCQHFPLDVEARDIAPVEAQYDAEFTRRTLQRIEYAYLVDAFTAVKKQCASSLSHAADIPPSLDGVDTKREDSPQLRAIHYALCAIAVKNGNLACHKCGTKYPIKEFIPNMMVS